jgi:hypothetical protein
MDFLRDTLASLNGQDTFCVYAILTIALICLALGFARLAYRSR